VFPRCRGHSIAGTLGAASTRADRRFLAGAADRLWVADFTYLRAERPAVMRTEQVTDALQMALAHRRLAIRWACRPSVAAPRTARTRAAERHAMSIGGLARLIRDTGVSYRRARHLARLGPMPDPEIRDRSASRSRSCSSSRRATRPSPRSTRSRASGVLSAREPPEPCTPPVDHEQARHGSRSTDGRIPSVDGARARCAGVITRRISRTRSASRMSRSRLATYHAARI
jgi:hypothetical protein